MGFWKRVLLSRVNVSQSTVTQFNYDCNMIVLMGLWAQMVATVTKKALLYEMMCIQKKYYNFSVIYPRYPILFAFYSIVIYKRFIYGM